MPHDDDDYLAAAMARKQSSGSDTAALELSVERIEAVRQDSAFLAFAGLMGGFIRRGRAQLAFLALEAIGAPAGMAYQIADGWPIEAAHRSLPVELDVPVELEAAIRFSFFVEDWERYDWADVLIEALDRVYGPPPPQSPKEPLASIGQSG